MRANSWPGSVARQAGIKVNPRPWPVRTRGSSSDGCTALRSHERCALGRRATRQSAAGCAPRGRRSEPPALAPAVQRVMRVRHAPSVAVAPATSSRQAVGYQFRLPPGRRLSPWRGHSAASRADEATGVGHGFSQAGCGVAGRQGSSLASRRARDAELLEDRREATRPRPCADPLAQKPLGRCEK